MNSVIEHPIIFSTDMIQSILAGRKTQTRRILKYDLPPDAHQIQLWHAPDLPESQKAEEGIYFWSKPGLKRIPILPYGLPGHRLWVRETFHPKSANVEPPGQIAWYKADGTHLLEWVSWKPSIHMPRSVARIFLKVIDIRVERLNFISTHDAINEGIEFKDEELYGPFTQAATQLKFRFFKDYQTGKFNRSPEESFKSLWEKINGKKHPYKSNPWVWVVEFKKI